MDTKERGFSRGSVPQIFYACGRMASSRRESRLFELTVIVPTDSVRHIIGKGGKTIKAIQDSCNNAHVSPVPMDGGKTRMIIHSYNPIDAVNVRDQMYAILEKMGYEDVKREDQARREMVDLVSEAPRRGGAGAAAPAPSLGSRVRLPLPPPPASASAAPAAPAAASPLPLPNTRTEEEKLIPRGLLNFRSRRASHSTRRRLTRRANKYRR